MAEAEVLMQQIAVAERPGHAEPWVFGLSRAGAVYTYDPRHKGWRPLRRQLAAFVLVQIAVAPRAGSEPPAVFGVTATGNTMRYNFAARAWWPLERTILSGASTRSGHAMPAEGIRVGQESA
jgi:hypothetical protein